MTYPLIERLGVPIKRDHDGVPYVGTASLRQALGLRWKEYCDTQWPRTQGMFGPYPDDVEQALNMMGRRECLASAAL